MSKQEFKKLKCFENPKWIVLQYKIVKDKKFKHYKIEVIYVDVCQTFIS